MYSVQFVLRGQVAYEADIDLPTYEEEEELEQVQQNVPKTRGRKPGKKQAAAVVAPVITPNNSKNKNGNKKTVTPPPPVQTLPKRGPGRQAKNKKGYNDYGNQQEDESERSYKEETSKKQKKGKKQVVDSYQDDDDDNDEGEAQGSEDEQKLLELEGELEEELAHLGEDGEDVDNFYEDDDNDELEKLERYASERPIAKLLQSQRFKDLENMSDSNLSEDPNYQKLTKRQKNIVKNNMSGQQDIEYLQLPNQVMNKKKDKFVTEEDQLKKVEKEEKRRAQMQKQMEDLKRQTVDKILNEAGTKQKKRKEKEQMEKDNRVNHQYRKLPLNEPRIRLLNNTEGSIVTITDTVFNQILNPFPKKVVFDNNLIAVLENQIIASQSQVLDGQTSNANNTNQINKSNITNNNEQQQSSEKNNLNVTEEQQLVGEVF